jgi:predicted nucleic acid-binding protein
LLSLVGGSEFEINLSVPLLLEYEAATKKMSRALGLTHSDIDDVLDYLCRVANHREIYFLWRPFLRDPGDDLVLELAVEAACEYIVTHNLADFEGIERFGLAAISPREFLGVAGALP